MPSRLIGKRIDHGERGWAQAQREPQRRGRFLICQFKTLHQEGGDLFLDDVFDLGLSAVLDAFQTANELIGMAGLTVPRFEVKIAGVRKAVKTSQGLTVPLNANGWRAPDCVVVPAIGFKMPGPLESALARPDMRDAGASLRQWARRGATMTAACIGTFVMAESGLLDHHHATTHMVAGAVVSQAISQCRVG